MLNYMTFFTSSFAMFFDLYDVYRTNQLHVLNIEFYIVILDR